MSKRFATVIEVISVFFASIGVLGFPYFINGFLKDKYMFAFWAITFVLIVIVFIYEIFKIIFLPLGDNWPDPEKDFSLIVLANTFILFLYLIINKYTSIKGIGKEILQGYLIILILFLIFSYSIVSYQLYNSYLEGKISILKLEIAILRFTYFYPVIALILVGIYMIFNIDQVSFQYSLLVILIFAVPFLVAQVRIVLISANKKNSVYYILFRGVQQEQENENEEQPELTEAEELEVIKSYMSTKALVATAIIDLYASLFLVGLLWVVLFT